MLVHRLRRWPSIAPWLSRRPVSAGNISVARWARCVEPVLFWGWASVVDGGSALKQHCFDALCFLG